MRSGLTLGRNISSSLWLKLKSLPFSVFGLPFLKEQITSGLGRWLRSSSRTHTEVEGENKHYQVVLWPPHDWCGMWLYIHTSYICTVTDEKNLTVYSQTSEPFQSAHETPRYTQTEELSDRRTPRLPYQSLGLQEPEIEAPSESTSIHSSNIFFFPQCH